MYFKCTRSHQPVIEPGSLYFKLELHEYKSCRPSTCFGRSGGKIGVESFGLSSNLWGLLGGYSREHCPTPTLVGPGDRQPGWLGPHTSYTKYQQTNTMHI